MNWILVAICITAISFPCSASSEWCLKPKPQEPTQEPTETTDPTESSPTEEVPKIPQCSGSLENIIRGRLVNGSSPREENLLPPWVNLTLARQGQKWASEFSPLLGNSAIYGLIFVLSFPDINAVLLFTNQSDTAEKAANRYGSTIRQIQAWYENFLKEEVDDNGAWESLQKVRGFHIAAMNAGNKRLHEEKGNLINKDLYERISLDEGMWTAFKKDLEASEIKNRKLPDSYEGRDGTFFSVNQFQQAMTQFAFIGFPVLFPERLLILNAKEDDLYAFNHLWAVLGYALGIDDEYNIALQPDLKSTREYYQHIMDDWYIPNLFNLDFHTKILLEAQLKGFEIINDVLTPKTLLLRLLKDIVNIPVPNMLKELSLKDHGKMLQFHGQAVQGFIKKLRQTAQDKREDFFDNVRSKIKERIRNRA